MQNLRAYFGLLALAVGCSSGPPSSTFGDTPGGTTGTGGASIIPYDAQVLGEASADGGVSVPGDDCPATAPAQGSACTVAQLECTYDACSTDAGSTPVTTATCDGSKWTVASAACAAFPCPAVGTKKVDCKAGEICVALKYPGNLTGVGCYPNPCGTGPITCRCVTASPTSPCAGVCSSVVGHEVQCVSQ